MPSHQGELDGLCGQYAIAHAFSICLNDEYEYGVEDYFQAACRGLANGRWPDAIWDGSQFGDMRRMIANCRREYEELEEVDVRYPFLRHAPKTNADYWKKFDEIFSNDAITCGIVGLTKPDPHWIVICRDGKTLVFVDSNPYRPVVRKYRKSLHAGERRRNKNQWLIDRRELIIFENRQPV